MEELFRQVETLADDHGDSLPPVDQWEPAFSGDLNLRIDRSGRWYYEDSPFKRPRLVRLFSTILKREGDDYFLVTPVEKWRIQVDDVPFLVVNFEQQRDENGRQCLRFQTSTDDRVIADRDHPLWVEKSSDGEPRPYLMIRGNMPGLVHRNVYYRLVDLAMEQGGEQDGQLFIDSAGERFALHVD